MLVAVKGKDTKKWMDFRQWYVALDRPVALYNGFALDEGKDKALELTADQIADDYKKKFGLGDGMAPWYYVVDVDDETAVWLAMRFSAMRTRSSVG
jgi:hypothetical protein